MFTTFQLEALFLVFVIQTLHIYVCDTASHWWFAVSPDQDLCKRISSPSLAVDLNNLDVSTLTSAGLNSGSLGGSGSGGLGAAAGLGSSFFLGAMLMVTMQHRGMETAQGQTHSGYRTPCCWRPLYPQSDRYALPPFVQERCQIQRGTP